MKDFFTQQIIKATQSEKITSQELIQTLWSGYGEILKLELSNSRKANSVIVKYIDLPDNASHPRGWNTKLSHQRKVKSYEVEMAWYNHYSKICDSSCRVAQLYGSVSTADSHIIIMEDLDASGFPIRKSHLDKEGVKTCLSWLANFHATFINVTPDGLWQTGSYWHLETRPDELKEMANGPLKLYASEIDKKLSNCKYQTFVHGDAKVANFCFSQDELSVAAVDFQYIGGGCGMKDVAYFLGSCLDEYECQRGEEEYLDHYFSELKLALDINKSKIDVQELEAEWRDMYAWAWTDFYRFLLGWMPTHYKIHSYTKELSDRVLKEINQ